MTVISNNMIRLYKGYFKTADVPNVMRNLTPVKVQKEVTDRSALPVWMEIFEKVPV